MSTMILSSRRRASSDSVSAAWVCANCPFRRSFSSRRTAISMCFSSTCLASAPCVAQSLSHCAAVIILSRKLRPAAAFRTNKAPIQSLEQGREHGRRYPHHAIAHLGPYELATFQPLVHQHQSSPVPDQNLHTVSPFRAEHKGRPTEWIKPEHLLHQCRNHHDLYGSPPGVSRCTLSDRLPA